MRLLHCVLAVISLIVPTAPAAARAPETPLVFERDRGQAPTRINYVACGAGNLAIAGETSSPTGPGIVSQFIAGGASDETTLAMAVHRAGRGDVFVFGAALAARSWASGRTNGRK